MADEVAEQAERDALRARVGAGAPAALRSPPSATTWRAPRRAWIHGIAQAWAKQSAAAGNVSGSITSSATPGTQNRTTTQNVHAVQRRPTRRSVRSDASPRQCSRAASSRRPGGAAPARGPPALRPAPALTRQPPAIGRRMTTSSASSGSSLTTSAVPSGFATDAIIPRSSSARNASTAASSPPASVVHSASVVWPVRSILINRPMENLLVKSVGAGAILRPARDPCVTSGPQLSRIAAVATYDPQQIEARWQALWAEERTWEVANPGEPGFDDSKPKAYVLEMLPYPSGEPHVGHPKNYALGDAIAHFRRRTGHQVIHPMGYDAFGLPAENAAIRSGKHPREATFESIEEFRRQFRSWGISIDWSREIATCEPEYYRWTQWIFLKLFEQGLAYRENAAVQWCPVDQTVLANEQVIDGHCERCGSLVEARDLEQWFFRITAYADRLLADFDLLESWPEHVVTMQRNWVGRSEGAEVTFRNEELGIDFPVFTTRPDTLFGATFFVLAPEHPELERLAAGTDREQRGPRRTSTRRSASRAPSAATTPARRPASRSAARVINPVNGEQIPMFVADYVLMEYGTGAIMAVPAHDARDHAFAKTFELPIRRVDRRRRATTEPRPCRGRADDRQRPLRRHGQPRRLRGDRRLADRGGPRRARRQLPAPRLAALPPALLGLPDPDRLLRRARPRAGP